MAVFTLRRNVLAHSSAPVALDSALDKIKINYRLGVEQLPFVPVRKIFHAQDDSALVAEFHDAVVLVGVISSQLGFARPAPVDPDMPVVAIHAQIVENLLAKSAAGSAMAVAARSPVLRRSLDVVENAKAANDNHHSPRSYHVVHCCCPQRCGNFISSSRFTPVSPALCSSQFPT